MLVGSSLQPDRAPLERHVGSRSPAAHLCRSYGARFPREIDTTNMPLLRSYKSATIRHYFRFSFRITNFSPDHFSSTAHTFTSTSPRGKAASRTVSSVISVGSFADFLYQETQI